MNFNEIINNAAFMGVVGVILGSVISGIIGSINNKNNSDFQKKLAWIEKNEKTTIGFLILMQKVKTLNLAKTNGPRDEELIHKLETEIVELNEQVKAEAQFYYEKKDYELFMEICGTVNPTSKEEADYFNTIRSQKMDQLLENIRSIAGR